jgi:hypothetical protein
MSAKKIGLGLIVVSVIAFALLRATAPKSPSPEPTPAPVATIPAELAADLQALEIPARDRAVWAGMLSALGRILAADGETKAPLFATMADVENLRNAAVRVPVEPVAGGDKIGATVGPHIAKIGGPADPLDPPRRAAIVNLLQGCARALDGN